MQAFARWLQRIGQVMSVAAIAVIALLAFPIFYDALARKAGAPTIWVFDVSQYALIAASFLANAYALKHGNHFRVQILLSAYPRARRALDDLALLTTLGFGVVILAAGGMLTHYSYANAIRSASIFDIPLWLPQLMVPLGGLALVLQSLAMLILRESPSETVEFE
ncbi:MAG: TRAP transporter small permease subunit [Pseudomonadota bacterium]